MTSNFNLSTVFSTVAHAVPDQDLLVWRGRRFSYAEVDARVSGFAHFLASRGLGCRQERRDLANHESGQDHVGLYLRNGNEYLEAMIGSYRARAAAININYRYARQELEHLLLDAAVRALVYHAEFAPVVADVVAGLPQEVVLVQVADESGNALVPGAVPYEVATTTMAPVGGMPAPTGDDLYVLYTGGTTGAPKGVLWRQDDAYVTSMGGTPFGVAESFTTYAEVAEAARTNAGAIRVCVIAPLMHGAAQWTAFHTITNGGTLVLPDDVRRLDPAQVLRTIETERVVSLPIVGDAMARPVIGELDANGAAYDLSGLAAISNGSAPLTPAVRDRLLRLLPHVLLIDSAGSSETGIQLSAVGTSASDFAVSTFTPHPDTAVLDDRLTRTLGPGEDAGWLARTGRIPLGYLGDADKTTSTFPVVDGARWAIPGDRARVLADGTVELLGRDGATINSGGEKIFAEEVERAIAGHPAVRDAVVIGRPSDRWGDEVCALVDLGDLDVSDEALLADWCTRLARYKLPKSIIRTTIVRSPSGKPDYRWARQTAAKTMPTS